MRLGWNLPLSRLSATSLTLGIQCPEQFRQKYLVRAKDDDIMFGSRFLGIVDHRVNERLMQMKMNGLDEEIDSVYRKIWNEEADKKEVDWRDDDPLKMMESGIKMAVTYHSLVDVKPIAVEEWFEVKVTGVPIPVVGKIDVIERDKIRERKTTGAKTTKPKSKWRFQGRIYQFATGLPVQWDVVTRQVTPQVFTADVWPELMMAKTDYKTTEQMIRFAAKRLNDLHAQYGADNPWPMEGIMHDWLCDYCVIGPKYERTCPAWAT